MRYLAALVFLAAAACLLAARPMAAQVEGTSDPSAALSDAFVAACRGDEVRFAGFFTVDNAAAFRALPADERKHLLQRFSLTDDPGRPLLSSDQDNHTILRCQTQGGETVFRFGDARVHENLAFIPVSVANSQQADIGMVREGGSWKLLSLGLVLLDIKQLSVQWAQADIAAHENAAVATLQKIASAIDGYKRTFGRLPDSLAQLGPAPKNQASPDQASLISAALAAGTDGGYRFHFTVVANASTSQYAIGAEPADYGTSGEESFFRDISGQIHAADKHGAAADATDPLWQDEKTQ